jgi:hypothetical protein
MAQRAARCLRQPPWGRFALPGFGVIADVSATLQVLLSDALSTLAGPPLAQVHDLQGTIATNPAQLTVFLFEAAEDASARNRPRMRGSSPPDLSIRKPPLALLLRYLLTPWSGDRLTDHRILGRAMQALYDNAIMSGSALQGGLAGTDQALKITQSMLSLEERTRVWHAVQRPYRISASYEVRVVNLDSEREELLHAVATRALGYAVPDGGA